MSDISGVVYISCLSNGFTVNPRICNINVSWGEFCFHIPFIPPLDYVCYFIYMEKKLLYVNCAPECIFEEHIEIYTIPLYDRVGKNCSRIYSYVTHNS